MGHSYKIWGSCGAQLQDMGLLWGTATRYGALVGQDSGHSKGQVLWRNTVVVALCSTGDEEEK